MKSVSQRFNEKVDVCEQSGCHLWTGATRPNGYGVIHVDGKLVSVHRHAYSAVFGPVPDGHEVTQICGNRACVNPVHLEAQPLHTSLRRTQEAARVQRKRERRGDFPLSPEIETIVYNLRRGLVDVDEVAPLLVALPPGELRAVEIAVADSVDVHVLRSQLKAARKKVA